jgi:ribosome-associated protein
VNRTATKVELRWNVGLGDRRGDAGPAAGGAGGQAGADGTLRVVASGSRSQAANREEALERLQGIVAKALVPRKKRRPTKPTAASRARRVEEKKQRARTKRLRGPISET